MSLAKDLEIYRSADALLALALQVQAQVPRAYRVAVGLRISNECADILLTVGRGIDFVGHVIKPWRHTTRRSTVQAADVITALRAAA